MTYGDQAIEALRQALSVSPDNVPLRLHLAASLMGIGRLADAESEYRQALAMAADNNDVRVGLAECYYRQEKTSQSLVIIEDLVGKRDAPARAYVLYTRLLLKDGDVPNAVAQETRNSLSDWGLSRKRTPAKSSRAVSANRMVKTFPSLMWMSNGRKSSSTTWAGWTS